MSPSAFAQKTALGTNILGYANFVTLNAEASYALGRHNTFSAGIKYNPFVFPYGEEGQSLRNKQLSLAVGGRWWPWHIYSGWWFAGKAQYQMYNTGGILDPETVEGDRIGIGAAFGYARMLSSHLNLEMGIGGWAGTDRYTIYECPVCGLEQGSGRKFFVLPNDLILALSYVF